MLWLTAALFVLWIALHLKTSRPDGDLVRPLHPYRRIMAYIMPARNESLVYFESQSDAAPLLDYLAEARKRFDVDISHCLVAGAALLMFQNPTINRFVVGRRLYQRKHVAVTFSMKRKALDRAAKLATVKTVVRPGETFRQLCERINEQIGVERSGTKTYADKEFDLFEMLPRPLMRAGVRAIKTLDYFNLLPASFIANDPLYTSMFVANLGSLDMDAGFHHLYEWGTCSAFMMAGRIEDRAVVEDGRVTVRRTLHVRYTYDERADDGLNAGYALASFTRAIGNPYQYFGCLRDDGSDARSLDAPDRALPSRLSEASAGARAAG